MPRIETIEAAARAAAGHPALGDADWLDLASPGPDSAGFLVDDRAFAHVARGENAAPRHWTLGLVVAPEAQGDMSRRALIAAAVEHVATHGGGRIVCWILGADVDDDAALATGGLHPARDLYEMRVGLPIGRPATWPPGIDVRTFEPGRDDGAWLEVNNRAFAAHAEQGGWTATTLERRIGEPWFDPSLFFLALDSDGLLGFNWLKVHDAHDRDPELGEIYVIGVDPRGQGRGLGLSLALVGLNALDDRGIQTGMLFCAADNEPALALYRSLGFDIHRVDRAYELEVAAK